MGDMVESVRSAGAAVPRPAACFPQLIHSGALLGNQFTRNLIAPVDLQFGGRHKVRKDQRQKPGGV